jgi:signal transduction histidine kinase
MGSASAIALAFSAVSLFAAAFNAWIWWLRRSQSAHLWLALAAVGTSATGGLTALLYEASDPEIVRVIQRFMLGTGGLIIVGFTYFSGELLGENRPGPVRAAWLLGLSGAVLGAWPGAFFVGLPQHSITGMVDDAMLRTNASPIGILYLLGVLALFINLIALFVRRRDRLGDDRHVMLGVLLLWFGTGANDIAVGMGLYQGPLLISLGYGGFVAGFTAILTRRMTQSMNLVEQSAEYLTELVERRTEELREREIQLAHGEQMATVGTLAAGVAHEINTPIAFVTSNFNRLEELRGDPKELEEVRQILAECGDGVDRIRAIVSDLLDLAQPDECVGERILLPEIVASALPIVGAEARNRAEIIEDYGPDVPAVIGDPRQLGQVVVNLVMNALQAIAPGHLAENRVTIATRYVGGRVQLIVRDTGPGIPDDVHARIFDPFFTTKASGGTGLGLAVTQQLVGQQRGQITLESTPAGTEAIVSLPPHEG